MDLGLTRAGLEVGQSFEIDETCCEVARDNFGHEVKRCDLTQKRVADEKPCNVRVFTYPCTKYSTTADIHGTRLVKDSRFPRGVRPYTVREYARLQGVPDTFKFTCSDSDAYRMIGNGVSIPVGEWLGNEILRYFKSL
jgi:site-specific DNA-cytosine methylase